MTQPKIRMLVLLLIGLILQSQIFAATVNRKPPYLDSSETRRYSHIHWQQPIGEPISVLLLPTVNATGKEAHESGSIKGKDADLSTYPVPIDPLFAELINNTHFLDSTAKAPEMFLQFHIQQFDSLYALTPYTDPLSQALALIDQGWSKLNGDNKPARVVLKLAVYDAKQKLVLEVPVKSTLDACERALDSMIFSPAVDQQFYNEFAATTTGQTLIAAANRALEEVAIHFADRRIRGRVTAIEGNEVEVNLGKQVVYRYDQLHLLSANTENPRVVGLLEVEQVESDYAVLHPLNFKVANIQVGDRVQLQKPIQQNLWISVAGNKVGCIKPKSWRTSDTD